MSQDTLNAHLHIASSIESTRVKSSCNKCDSENPSQHCHCLLFEITDSLRETCKQAHRVCKENQVDNAATKKAFEEESSERKERALENEKKRIEKLKDDLKKRSQFCSSRHFEPIYNSKKDKKEGDKNAVEGSKKKVPSNNNRIN